MLMYLVFGSYKIILAPYHLFCFLLAFVCWKDLSGSCRCKSHTRMFTLSRG